MPNERKERMSLNHPPPDVQRRWVCGAIVLLSASQFKKTQNKSVLPQAMNIRVSPAEHNAIISRPQVPAGTNLLKPYFPEADVPEAQVAFRSFKLPIDRQVTSDTIL